MNYKRKKGVGERKAYRLKDLDISIKYNILT